MIVQIIRDEDNKPIGWSIKGETPKEKLIVNTIRNMQFFGYEDTAIEYAGRTDSDDANHDAGTLAWKLFIYHSIPHSKNPH